jgi:hypothetical protein
MGKLRRRCGFATAWLHLKGGTSILVWKRATESWNRGQSCEVSPSSEQSRSVNGKGSLVLSTVTYSSWETGPLGTGQFTYQQW